MLYDLRAAAAARALDIVMSFPQHVLGGVSPGVRFQPVDVMHYMY
jgi:hypothetical protein